MTDDEVLSAVVQWIAATTGAKAIRAHQSGPVPAGDYIAVNLLSTAEVQVHAQGYDYAEDAGSGRILATPIIETEWRFSCHCYAAAPTAALRKVRVAALMTQTTEPLMPALVLHDISQIRNVPDYINEQWRPRAQMDVWIRGLVRDGVLIDSIEDASIGFNTDAPQVKNIQRP